MSQGLVLVRYDNTLRFPLLPVDPATGDLTVFDGSTNAGWCLTHDLGTKNWPAVLIRLRALDATLLAIIGTPDVRYVIGATNGTIIDAALSGAQVLALESWLIASGVNEAWPHWAEFETITSRAELTQFLADRLNNRAFSELVAMTLGPDE